MLKNDFFDDYVLSGKAVKEFSGEGLELEDADTRSKCTIKNVKKPLSLNVLHAISISKQAEATKRSKQSGVQLDAKVKYEELYELVPENTVSTTRKPVPRKLQVMVLSTKRIVLIASLNQTRVLPKKVFRLLA